MLKAKVDATHEPNIDTVISAINAADNKSEFADVYKERISYNVENSEWNICGSAISARGFEFNDQFWYIEEFCLKMNLE